MGRDDLGPDEIAGVNRIVHRHGRSPFSVVVLKIQVHDLVVLDSKRQPPVAGDRQAPCALAVSGQKTGFPQRQAAQLCRVGGRIEEAKHLKELVYAVCVDLPESRLA